MKQPVTGSFELIKNLNTAVILNAIRDHELVSRADIARESGLTPATVSNLTAELLELGLIVEQQRGESSGGRKPVLLSISKTACYVAAVHISPNYVEAAVTDIDANILWSARRPFFHGIGPEKAMQYGSELVRLAQTHVPVGRKLSGVGVCVHGLVRSEDGVSVFAPNLGWENVAVGSMLQKATGLPVSVENDVRAMALAESWCGTARKNSDFVYLYVAEGIGGSIVVNNELFKGAGGFAGEFGHITIEPEGPLCSCGNRGCLQALASDTRVAQNYCLRRGVAPDSLTYDDVIAAAKQGDTTAADEILKSVRYLGIALGNIINDLSPSLIILNGSILRLGSVVMPALKEAVRQRGLKKGNGAVSIVFSGLGPSAPLRGAASCAIGEIFRSPRRYLA